MTTLLGILLLVATAVALWCAIALDELRTDVRAEREAWDRERKWLHAELHRERTKPPVVIVREVPRLRLVK